MISNSRQKGELRWVVIFSVIVMLITSVPYAIGLFRQDDEWVFSGAIINMEDVNSYFSNMVSGSSGAWLFRTPYTAVEQPQTLIFLPYLLLGKLASPPNLHLKIVMLYHVFRVVAGFLAILATYDFLSLFIRQVRWRRLVTALASVGGGLGWMIPLLGLRDYLGSMPIESYSPEAFGFLMLLCVPHLALARAFLLWSIRSYLDSARKEGRAFFSSSLRTGVLWLACALAQPLTGLVAGAIPITHAIVTGVWQLARKFFIKSGEPGLWKRHSASILIGGIVAGPFAIYNIYAFTQDAYLNQWTAQSYLPSASPLLYLLAYLLVLPLAVFGAIRLLKRDAWQGLLLSGWVIVFMCAMYIPFAYQRRLIEGVWVGLCALAGVALEALSERQRFQKMIRMGSAALIGLSLVTSVLLLSGMILQSLRPTDPVYIPADEAHAFEQLGGIAKQGDVVLSSSETGMLIPTWMAVRVVSGNSTLTGNFEQVNREIAGFFSDAWADTERQAYLQNTNVKYIFWGPEERRLGAWDPRSAAGFTEVITRGTYSVFTCP